MQYSHRDEIPLDDRDLVHKDIVKAFTAAMAAIDYAPLAAGWFVVAPNEQLDSRMAGLNLHVMCALISMLDDVMATSKVPEEHIEHIMSAFIDAVGPSISHYKAQRHGDGA